MFCIYHVLSLWKYFSLGLCFWESFFFPTCHKRYSKMQCPDEKGDDFLCDCSWSGEVGWATPLPLTLTDPGSFHLASLLQYLGPSTLSVLQSGLPERKGATGIWVIQGSVPEVCLSVLLSSSWTSTFREFWVCHVAGCWRVCSSTVEGMLPVWFCSAQWVFWSYVWC